VQAGTLPTKLVSAEIIVNNSGSFSRGINPFLSLFFEENK